MASVNHSREHSFVIIHYQRRRQNSNTQAERWQEPGNCTIKHERLKKSMKLWKLLHKKGDLDSSHFCDIWLFRRKQGAVDLYLEFWPEFLHLHDFSFFSQNKIPFLRSRVSLCFPLPLTLPAFSNNVVFLIYPWELFNSVNLTFHKVCVETHSSGKPAMWDNIPSQVLADPSNMKNVQQCTSFTVETTLRVFIWRGFKHRAKYNICWINNASHEVIFIKPERKKIKMLKWAKHGKFVRSTIWSSTFSSTGFSAELADFSSHFAHPHGDYKHLDVSVEGGLAAGHHWPPPWNILCSSHSVF